MTKQSSIPVTSQMFKEMVNAKLDAKRSNRTLISDRLITGAQKTVKRSILANSLAACFVLAFPVSQVSAETPIDPTANQCVTDLRSFHDQMQKDGYWLGGDHGAADANFDGSGYGYGYPLGGYGYGMMGGAGGSLTENSSAYLNARSGYEIRSLLAAANVLARHEQLKPCEDVLAATREHYEQYIADMEAAGMEMADVQGWQQKQIAAAQPVASITTRFRSDELLGADVRSPLNVALGSIDDVVTNSQTGEIAYLVIARGGWLGIGAHYVAVPWGAFRAPPDASLLVLNTTRSTLDTAPRANDGTFTAPGQQSQKVDDYWAVIIAKQPNN